MPEDKDSELLDRTTLPDRIAQLRDELLPGGAFEWELAAALDCSRRKIQQLGLPFDRIGGTRIYRVAGARKVLRPAETP